MKHIQSFGDLYSPLSPSFMDLQKRLNNICLALCRTIIILPKAVMVDVRRTALVAEKRSTGKTGTQALRIYQYHSPHFSALPFLLHHRGKNSITISRFHISDHLNMIEKLNRTAFTGNTASPEPFSILSVLSVNI